VKSVFRSRGLDGSLRAMDEEYSDYLTGHSEGREGREYGKYPVPELRDRIANVPAWEVAA
jgi:hypothetical protein